MCGYNNYGQLGNGNQVNVTTPTTLEDFKNKYVSFVACSYYHTIFVISKSYFYAKKL